MRFIYTLFYIVRFRIIWWWCDLKMAAWTAWAHVLAFWRAL